MTVDRAWIRFRIVVMGWLGILSTSSVANASENWIAAFLSRHCVACHGEDVQERELNLEKLSTDGTDTAAQRKWVMVFDRVKAGEMPPPGENRPTSTELETFLDSLGRELTEKHTQQKGTVFRRLNRREYQNTINDLLGIHEKLIDLLPEDGRALGFDNIGEALSISGIQMQRYMEAAETALNAALHTAVRPTSTIEHFSLDNERNKDFIGKHWLRRDDGSIVVFNNGGFPSTKIVNLRAQHVGNYRVSITGYGFQIKEPVIVALIAGSFERGGEAPIHSFHELPIGKPGTIKAIIHLDQGDGIKISPQGLNGPDGHSPVKDGPENYPGEGMAILDVTLEGPLIDAWPPRGRKLLLNDAEVREVLPEKSWLRNKRGYQPVFKAESNDPIADSQNNLPKFLEAAFRRPISPSELEPYIALFDHEFSISHDYLTAMKTAAIAALCSPEFLFFKEDPGTLTQQQLAVRLSYFLTRSRPDAELLDASLQDPSLLRDQTERLLNSPRFERFIEDFTDNWLNLREIEFTTPDKLLYPEYDDLLLDSMIRETRIFFKELIVENESLVNLVTSDYAMLNSRLARHYDLPELTGLEIRKVQLPPNNHRGGLLTQASILKVSANGTSTSPVVRGVWMMERILGIEPTPPPPGIPGVEPDIRGATTLREQLDKHRDSETCNVCHRLIDPPGFALENYDVIGGWRNRFRSMENGDQVRATVEGRKVRYRLGLPVDASGELSDGSKFANLGEFQELLLADQDRVARCLVEKLMTFATGRALGFSDRGELEKIVHESKSKGHLIRDLMHAIVQSTIFRSK